MNIYTLKFELEQITPMLHFQSNENRATVRGSDMKPQFDRFIREWYEVKEGQIPKNWKINDEHAALNYKLKVWIDSNGLRDQHIEINNRGRSVFHGNAGYTYKNPHFLRELSMYNLRFLMKI